MDPVDLEKMAAKNSKLYSRKLMSRAIDMMLSIRQTELAPYDISPRQAYILDILFRLGHRATLNQLAKYNERELNTISVQMTKMEKEGLIRKVRKTTKSTMLVFELTPKGLEIYNHSKEQKSEKIIMSVLSEEERQQFIAMLKKVIKKAEKYHEVQLESETS